MTAGNGDALEGTYSGTQDFSLKDENGYGPFQGTLTFTGGTGSFSYASGAVSFTAVTSPVSVGVTAPTVNGIAFYLVQGNVLSPAEAVASPGTGKGHHFSARVIQDLLQVRSSIAGPTGSVGPARPSEARGERERERAVTGIAPAG